MSPVTIHQIQISPVTIQQIPISLAKVYKILISQGNLYQILIGPTNLKQMPIFFLKWLPNPDRFSRPKCLTKSYQSYKSYQILICTVNVHKINKSLCKYLHRVKPSRRAKSSSVTQVIPGMLYNLTYSEPD